MPELLLAGLLLAACDEVPVGSDSCDRPETEQPIDYQGGAIEDGIYRTAEWDGELLDFPGGAYYRIHHELGVEPTWWLFYLSFERDGLGSGSVAQAAGNQAEVKAIDADTITVLNGSCAGYFLLAVVGAGEPPATD